VNRLRRKRNHVEGNWGYRIFTGKVGLIEIVGMRHVTPPKFAFKSNRLKHEKEARILNNMYIMSA